jgi:hypothetical protein
MQNLINDPSLVLALKEKGQNRLKQFSWSKTAIAIQSALEKI